CDTRPLVGPFRNDQQIEPADSFPLVPAQLTYRVPPLPPRTTRARCSWVWLALPWGSSYSSATYGRAAWGGPSHRCGNWYPSAVPVCSWSAAFPWYTSSFGRDAAVPGRGSSFPESCSLPRHTASALPTPSTNVVPIPAGFSLSQA